MKKVFKILFNSNTYFTKKSKEKILIIFIINIIIFAFYSCEICNNTENNTGASEEEIYFTASPENSKYPNIYKTTPQGNMINNIISNAIAFSSPSNNGKIVFIRKNEIDGSNNLFISDYNGANIRLITKDNDIFSINYPLISPNGKYITFNGGNSKLIYHDVNTGSLFNLISTRLATGSIPSFSYNSKYLAYVESSSEQNFVLKVVEAENTDILNTKYSKNLGNINFSDNTEILINWSSDSKSIIFTIRKTEEDEVYIINVENSEERVLILKNSEIGANQAILSPNNDFIAVSGKDGNIWLVFIATNDLKYSRITNSLGFERNFSPKWSQKGDKILFNSVSPLDNGIYSTLICSELEYSSVLVKPIKSYILSNNVYRGFWNNNKVDL